MDQASNCPYVTLNNGNKMPQISFGTGRFDKEYGNAKEVMIKAVLEHSYRLIDSAKVYDTEEIVGEVLQKCFSKGIKREEMFITTKLWPSDKDNVESQIRESLKRLKLDYVDLYLIHWMYPKMDWSDPNNLKFSDTPNHKVWAQMERLVELGLVKNIGVSNCTLPMLLDMMCYAKIKPVVNQIEIHPYHVQKDFDDFHKKLKVQVEAYGPLSGASFPARKEEYKGLNVIKDPLITGKANKYNKEPSQIILNWHLQRGHVVITNTYKEEHLEENFKVFDFKLFQADYDSITALDKNAPFYDPLYYKEYERDLLLLI